MPDLISCARAVVISDLHVGDPRNPRLDDFDRDDDFERLLNEVIPTQVGWPATLIINGDFIDFPQVMPELGRHKFGDRLGVTEDQSVAKFAKVREGHPKVFDSMKRYLEREGGQILILPGNHDIDLHWPDVLSELRKAIGGAQSPQLDFVRQGHLTERKVYIEHGNQYSFDNYFEFWGAPFLRDSWNRERIERPWGTFFMDMVYNDIEELYPAVNKVYPHSRLAALAVISFFKGEFGIGKKVAKLIFFLLVKGKRFGMGRLLSGDDEEPTPATVEDFLLDLGADPRDPRFDELMAETAELIAAHKASLEARAGARPDADGGDEAPPSFIEDGPAATTEEVVEVEGLLGRTDKRGMKKRQVELWEHGKLDLIAFGHTHAAVDGNKHPPHGLKSPRRSFNTGSWMPSIPIGEYESPKWAELASMPRTYDLRYLVIEFGATPRGRLASL